MGSLCVPMRMEIPTDPGGLRSYELNPFGFILSEYHVPRIVPGAGKHGPGQGLLCLTTAVESCHLLCRVLAHRLDSSWRVLGTGQATYLSRFISQMRDRLREGR